MTPTVTDSAVLTALRAFLLTVLPTGVEVIQAQDNRVPEPTVGDFVTMTPTSRVRLATNEEIWDPENVDPVEIANTAPTQLCVQLDVHGPVSADNSQVISTTFRSMYGVDAFPAGIKPLYCDDPVQMPFLNAERAYENRWVIKVYIQANPTVSTPMQFADTVAVTTYAPADSGAS